MWTGWTPALMMQKGAAPALAALIASVTLWAAIPSTLLLPRLSDKLGLRKPFIWGPSFVLAFATLGVIYITVPMSWFLMAFIGVAHATRFAIIMALPAEMMPRKVVGASSGLILSVGYMGGIIGPLVGGRIFDVTGNLDLPFFILIGITIVSGIIALKIPETGPRDTRAHVNGC